MTETVQLPSCFKAYDIRGRLGEELNPELAFRIGRAMAQVLQAKLVIVGGDIRLSSPELKQALTEGLLASGSDVIDIGLVGTEEIYFAVRHLNADGGVMVTASHNPIDYNGMKLVREQSKPIAPDSGLTEIGLLAQAGTFAAATPGSLQQRSILAPYIDHLCGYFDRHALRPMTLLVNAGNGAAGHVIDALELRFNQQRIPIRFIKLHHQPDGNFPNGIPNPLLPESRQDTSAAVVAAGADMGIAWDGDFDRCFLFDHQGQFIEGYYIVGLLAAAFAAKEPGAKIIHDPRLLWNTQQIAERHQATAIQSRTGHGFIKQQMRQHDAVYGGEMSAHHYFREFGYCDSGMIPWLLVCELISRRDTSLQQLVAQMQQDYPSSGELNFEIAEPPLALAAIRDHFQSRASQVDTTDGVSMCFSEPRGQWRFNLRASNTEPLVRLNVEARSDLALMHAVTAELTQRLQPFLI
ncbi:phosphomannomutase/phosphoglucomutase [Ferrimonas senticii]|uniref:phosphomannomutase/phosphoglucomutase n=1 Tax=Ferrimonas senticii TaxID=394566 RepID=UPI0004025F4F|nr:phosphomannomutase/phosphoglucomutase [Ferrimonas senticii]